MFARITPAFLLSLLFCLCPVVAPAASTGAASPGPLSFRPPDPLNSSAFEHFYNLEYDAAIHDFELVLHKHPDDPFAVNHLLTAVLFKELYRMGALDSTDYASDNFVVKPPRPADPKVEEQIKELVHRATALEDKTLQSNPNDVDALYARGVTRAQFATYTALMERAWFSALRRAVGARRDHERVLELSPSYTDAKLVVGAHNYVMGSLPWGIKVAVALVRLSGSKEKGLQYLRDAAASNGETSVDAKILLALFLRREQQYPEALHIVRDLIPQYPHDVLLPLEEGHLLHSMGKNSEAAAVYRKAWQMGREGHYAGVHYEISAFALGNLLREEKDYFGAAAAYEQVSEGKDADPQILQKADLAAGEMYDVMQKRDLAVKKYEAVVGLNAKTPPAETARKRMKEAYRQD